MLWAVPPVLTSGCPMPVDCSDLDAYLRKHGRPPFLGEPRPPWTYCGWARYYIVAHHADSRVPFPDRWGYLGYLRAYFADWPDDEPVRWSKHPIPRVEFTPPDQGVLKNLKTAIEIAGEGGSLGFGWRAFERLISWIGFALGVAAELPDCPESVHEKLYRHLDLSSWLLAPSDYLGAIAAEKHGKGWNVHAFFPTPHPVCEVMASMQLAGADNRASSVLDCCVGSGRMLLHASNHSLYLYAQDIDPLMIQMTKINGAMYAPWLLFPLPERFQIGPQLRALAKRLPPPRKKRRSVS